MKILNEKNEIIEITKIIEKEKDVYYCYLDFNNKNSPDFFYANLLYLESFYSPAIEILIGENDVVMLPYDWYILIGDKNAKDCEFINLKYVNGKDFSCFVFNPKNGYIANFMKIKVLNIYNSIKWFFPKLKQNIALCYPINKSEKPDCIFICQYLSNKNSFVDYTLLI